VRRRAAAAVHRARRALERRRQSRPGDAVVYAYHRIATPESDPWKLAVSPERFEEQITALREEFHPLSLAELADALAAGRIPRRSVAITFDDGYRDNLEVAKPILERHGVPATVFVATGYTGAGRNFWWDDHDLLCQAAGRSREELRASWQRLRELPHDERLEKLDALLSEAGQTPTSPLPMTENDLIALTAGDLVEIGAHTATHPRLPSLSKADQLAEVTASKNFLEELLTRRIDSFAYPHGEYERATVDCVRQAGFRYACAVGQRAVTARTSRFEIPRVDAQDFSGAELAQDLRRRLRA
jgi:peptidoglycan/xylan/chitin deacetylase (PgdA/CDA1 family)